MGCSTACIRSNDNSTKVCFAYFDFSPGEAPDNEGAGSLLIRSFLIRDSYFVILFTPAPARSRCARVCPSLPMRL